MNIIRIMAGLMGATAFLSMWMNNTASTSIMLPVALAIVHELDVHSENSLARQKDNTPTAAIINGTRMLNSYS
jgi:di/tricarboxylate transporter